MSLFEEAFISLNLQNIFIIGIILILAFRILNAPRNLPPSPWGFPIIGVLPRLGKEVYLTFTKWSREYGNIFSVKIGGNVVVVLNDIEVAKEAFVKHSEQCSDRPALNDVKLGITIPGSLVFENGPIWKERRRWALGALRNFGVGKRSLESKINEEAIHICQEIERKASASTMFDPYHILNNGISNIICSISFGQRFDYQDTNFKFILKSLKEMFATLSQVSLLNFFPFLWYTPYSNRQKTLYNSIKDFIVNIVDEHRETFDPKDLRDIIDHNIDAINRQKEEGKKIVFDVNRIWRGVQDLFQAGTETTTNTMVWIILYMLNFPEVQEKAKKEIEDVLGQRVPSWIDRSELPYVRAMIMEVQRHSTVAHSNVPRCTTAEIKLKGYTIPANTRLLLNSWGVHHDPKVWEEPYEFNPLRHLEEDGRTIIQNEAFIPFGIGDRICIGQLLAKMELFLITVNLLQNFTFKVPDSQLTPSLTKVHVGIVRSPKRFCVSVEKRT